MISLWVAFLTGLTAGGLSCLAVQSGLLASSIAHRLETDVARGQSSNTNPRGRRDTPDHTAVDGQQVGASAARPVLLFLSAKLFAYTVLGFLLGALGSLLQLTAIARALLQLGVGIFMIGNALRMLNVHPIFRYFVFEPPSWLTRRIRRTAKRDASPVTPLFLGALTVFIPCGVTQTMMATAMGSGDAVAGAALMASFTLGTSPVFFAVAYSAARLGARLERAFVRVAAVVVLVLGFVSVEAGLNLLGSPVSATRLARAARSFVVSASGSDTVAERNGSDADATVAEPDVQVLGIEVRYDGYVPSTHHAAANVPTTLVLRTDHTRSCARAFVMPSLKLERLLPESGEVSIDIPPQVPGTVLRYSCSMGMYTGEIIFDR